EGPAVPFFLRPAERPPGRSRPDDGSPPDPQRHDDGVVPGAGWRAPGWRVDGWERAQAGWLKNLPDRQIASPRGRLLDADSARLRRDVQHHALPPERVHVHRSDVQP